MSICVEVVGDYVMSSVDVYPACTDFALVTSTQISALTYWADLAVQLEPGNGLFTPLLVAMFTTVGVVLGLRVAIETLRTYMEGA